MVQTSTTPITKKDKGVFVDSLTHTSLKLASVQFDISMKDAAEEAIQDWVKKKTAAKKNQVSE